ncbi:hypothetical protein KWH47_14910 [Xanthomonas campestris pv. spermacoces]|uniref:hypothetical protein n=1 Tax=Xanthomonas euvesicatoria TaxID=456327 RepID=UPI001C45F072|nr:hypothetical protein [Xanthomonas euvesicatoria]MBV6888829.1 hypothetical protein [Xanthomonas campestris pv. spermacoces]
MATYFGVGCFHFGLSKPVPYKFEFREYIEEIHKALGALTNASNINIKADRSGSIFPDHVEISGIALRKNGVIFPNTLDMIVEFSLYIPARIQDELGPFKETSKATSTENFHVRIKYEFQTPVAIITLINPASEDPSPSRAVAMIRKYLDREIAKSNTEIMFDWLGPSPFHAEFSAEADPASDYGFVLKKIPSRGYDKINILYGKDINKNQAEAYIYDSISSDASVFYEIIRTRSFMYRAQEKVVSQWKNLQGLIDSGEARASRGRKKILEAANLLVRESHSLMASQKVHRQAAERVVKEHFGRGEDDFLEHYVESELKGLPEYPAQDILEWAKYIEEGLLKKKDRFNVLLTGMLGGLIGALATIVSGLSKSS